MSKLISNAAFDIRILLEQSTGSTGIRSIEFYSIPSMLIIGGMSWCLD